MEYVINSGLCCAVRAPVVAQRTSGGEIANKRLVARFTRAHGEFTPTTSSPTLFL